MYIDEGLKSEVRRNREYLHQIPELGYEEYKTSEYIIRKLKQYGYKIERVAGTGVIAFRKGIDVRDETIAFRADMDALQIEEKTKIDFESKHKGYMHACGHDGHMSILLGFAEYVSGLKHINKNLLLIFQPAEEGPGGAEKIVAEGILKRYAVKAIFGLHIHPSIDEGKIGLRQGSMMARCGNIALSVNGRGSHGAMPEKGIDSIYVASQLINSYQSIISRNVDSSEGGVISIGTINGGEARNILAESVNMTGTIRAFKDHIYEEIVKRIETINKGVEISYGVKVDCDIEDMYPAVINDYYLYNRIANDLDSRDLEPISPMMIAEDFSYYQKEIPGLFFILGSKNYEKGYTEPLHSPRFNFSIEVLYKGIETYIDIAKSMGVVLD